MPGQWVEFQGSTSQGLKGSNYSLTTTQMLNCLLASVAQLCASWEMGEGPLALSQGKGINNKFFGSIGAQRKPIFPMTLKIFPALKCSLF